MMNGKLPMLHEKARLTEPASEAVIGLISIA